jgi:hypothetical protein
LRARVLVGSRSARARYLYSVQMLSSTFKTVFVWSHASPQPAAVVHPRSEGARGRFFATVKGWAAVVVSPVLYAAALCTLARR